MVVTPHLRRLVSWILIGVGLGGAWSHRWVSDDAFISFRYARNLVDGHGLVYNLGERVEGYTNFSWTLWVSLGMAFGMDPVAWSIGWGIAAFAALLGVMISQRGAALPVGAAILAFHPHVWDFSTSGLEGSLYALLLLLVVLGAARARRTWEVAGVGLLGALLVFTRPDGALVVAIATLTLAIRVPRRLWAFLSPLLLLLPWLAWKYTFYGDLLPNTYYAKSADVAYWSCGWAYVWGWLRAYPTLIVAQGAALVELGLSWPRRREDPDGFALRALLALTPPLVLAGVARVGGDFMFGRFCVPVVALQALGFELWLGRLGAPHRWGGAALGLLLAALPLVHRPQFRPGLDVNDERLFYPPGMVEQARDRGEELQKVFEGLPVRVVIGGMQAMIAYYAEIPYVLEGATGLTDRELAHRPVTTRGRPGHEKTATIEDLRRRGVHFDFTFPAEPAGEPGYTLIDFGPLRGYVLVYETPLMEALAGRGARFVDFPRFLDAYLANLDRLDPADVRADLTDFRAYYFDHNDDPARLARFESWLQGR